MNAPLIIDIPNSVPRILSPNSRSHWGTKAQVQARVKADAMWATIDAAGNTPEGALMCLKDAPLPLTLHFAVGWESRRRKRMDDDNIKASLKWHIDGIASALGIDDRHMIVGTVTQTYDEAKRGFVRVAVEPAREARS